MPAPPPAKRVDGKEDPPDKKKCRKAKPPDKPKSVRVADGEKVVNVSDLGIRGRGMDFVFSRTYRSFDPRPNLPGALPLPKDFGENWTLSYAGDFLVKDGSGAQQDASFFHFMDDLSAVLRVRHAQHRRWSRGHEVGRLHDLGIGLALLVLSETARPRRGLASGSGSRKRSGKKIN